MEFYALSRILLSFRLCFVPGLSWSIRICHTRHAFKLIFALQLPSIFVGPRPLKLDKAKICIRITMLEYILVIWLIGIQAERIKKFLALPSKSFGEKIFLASKDKWNFIYFLSLMTFIAGLALRVVSTLDYQGKQKRGWSQCCSKSLSANQKSIRPMSPVLFQIFLSKISNLLEVLLVSQFTRGLI